jgi:hypothetical protein
MAMSQKQKQVRYVIGRIERQEYKHGTAYCYGHLGCRLPECREAMRTHQQKYGVSS